MSEDNAKEVGRGEKVVGAVTGQQTVVKEENHTYSNFVMVSKK